MFIACHLADPRQRNNPARYFIEWFGPVFNLLRLFPAAAQPLSRLLFPPVKNLCTKHHCQYFRLAWLQYGRNGCAGIYPAAVAR